MAINPDPKIDLVRCADLLDQNAMLVRHFADPDEVALIITGIAQRIRVNALMIEQGRRGDDADFDEWVETL